MVIALSTRAQDDGVRIYGEATDHTTGKALRSYTVLAIDTTDTTSRWSASVDLRGKYEMRLPYDHVYRVVMSAPDHWSKYVIVDVHDVEQAMRRAGFSLFIELDLFQPFPLADATLLARPMGIATYSPRKRNMVWNDAWTKQIRARWEAEERRAKAR